MTRKPRRKKQIITPKRDSKYFLNEEDDFTTTLLRDYQIISVQKHLEWVVQYVQHYPDQQPDKELRLNCADIAIVSFFEQVVELLPLPLQDGVMKLLALRQMYWNDRYPWQLEMQDEDGSA